MSHESVIREALAPSLCRAERDCVRDVCRGGDGDQHPAGHAIQATTPIDWLAVGAEITRAIASVHLTRYAPFGWVSELDALDRRLDRFARD